MKKTHAHQTNYILVAGVAALVSSSVVALGSLSRAQVTAEQRASCEASCKADTSADMPPPEQRDCAMWCEDGDYKGPAPSSGGGSTTSSCDWSQWNDPDCATAVCNTETKQISCTERRQSGGSGGGGQEGNFCPLPTGYRLEDCHSYCDQRQGGQMCHDECNRDGNPCGPASDVTGSPSGNQQCESECVVYNPNVATDDEARCCRDLCSQGRRDFATCTSPGQSSGPTQSPQYQGGMGCGEKQDRLPGYGYHWACQNGAWTREADGQGSGQQNPPYGAPPPMPPQEGPVQWPEEGIDVCDSVQANGGHPVCFKGTAWNGNAKVCAKMGLPMVGHECVRQVPPIYQIDRPDHRGGPSQYHGGPDGPQMMRGGQGGFPDMGGGMMGGPGGGMGGHMSCDMFDSIIEEMQSRLTEMDEEAADRWSDMEDRMREKAADQIDRLRDKIEDTDDTKKIAKYEKQITKAEAKLEKQITKMKARFEKQAAKMKARMEKELAKLEDKAAECEDYEE